jgi:hypothetical protein
MHRERNQRRPNNHAKMILENLLNSRVKVRFKNGASLTGVLFAYSLAPPYMIMIRADDGHTILCNLIAAEFIEEVR